MIPHRDGKENGVINFNDGCDIDGASSECDMYLVNKYIREVEHRCARSTPGSVSIDWEWCGE